MKGFSYPGTSPVRNDKNVLIAESTDNTTVMESGNPPTIKYGTKNFELHPSVKALRKAGAPENVIKAQIKKLKNKEKKNI